MPDWASSGGIKLERAKEHVSNLAADIEAFEKRDPYAVIRYFNRDSPDRIIASYPTAVLEWRLRIREKPPLRWGALIGDAIHNLRVSLEILWRQVTKAGNSSRDKFPILETADAFESRAKGAIGGRLEPVFDVLKAIKPYKGGNEQLWTLQVLDNADKHQLFLTTQISWPSVGIDPLQRRPSGPKIWSRPKDPVRAVDDGAVLYSLNKTPYGDMEPQFAFAIAFREPEIVQGKAVVPTLAPIVGEVDRVVDAFLIAGLLT